MRKFFTTSFVCISIAFGVAQAKTLLNASYDVSRELYKDINAEFIKENEKKEGKALSMSQSHNGSSKQARAVIDGLEADVVTMNQTSDIDIIARKGLISLGWEKAFPNNSSPYSSTILFLVRKGNPKNIHDWQDLVKANVQIVMPNPKTSGNGRYSYLAVLAFAREQFKNEPDADVKVNDFIKQIYRNTPILDAGGRAATTSFIQREIGDVLLTFESEVFQITRQFNQNDFEVIIPSISIQADFPVAVVSAVAQKHGNTDLAKAYLNFLFSNKGQAIIKKHYLRPFLNPNRVAEPEKNALVGTSKEWIVSTVKLVTVAQLGGWDYLMKTHFADGGLFDQIYTDK